MRRRLIELGKDVLIVLLALAIVWLLVLALPAQTVANTPWLAALVRPFAPWLGFSQTELLDTPLADTANVTGAAQPIAISVRNPAGRTSFQYDFDTLDAAFEQFGAALGQTLESAEAPSPVSESALQAALGKTSVAFCYPGEVSAALVSSWLHVQTALTQRAQWFVLAAQEERVMLYLVSDEIYASQTQLEAETLEQLLQSCTPDGSIFAFEDTGGYYDAVEPLCLLPAQTPQLQAAQAANPCEARFSDALAASLGFNPYGDSRYTDDSGTTTYTETGYALSISAAGLLQLRADPQSVRFQAASDSEAELVECARALLGTMSSGASGDARLYLTELTQEGTETVCSFDYCLNAIPVTLPGGHAAQVRFSGTSVVQAQLLLRTYTLDAQTLPLLPSAQAAAIVPAGSALRLVYSDSFSGISAGWQS